jgi:acyl-coenzyme A thioesterase PaaI-like protein
MGEGSESQRIDGPIEAHWDARKETGGEMWAQKCRLADAMRLVIERLVPSNAPVDELRGAADGLERYAEALQAHPRLIRVHGHAGDKTAVASATFGSAYEGPPASVHGGFVAAAFDEVLGYVQSLSGAPGMTGTSTVRYLQPSPLRQELRFEAELTRVRGRKIFTEGRTRAEGVVTAETQEILIFVDQARMQALMARRNAWEASQARPTSD